MLFDFERFSRIAADVYSRCCNDSPYSLDDVLFVFQHYFDRYEDCMGRPHPPINAVQIRNIMQKMPVMRGKYSDYMVADFDAAEYPPLIDLHFKTRYRNCDYNINHFFSGKIRELRLYEMVVRYT